MPLGIGLLEKEAELRSELSSIHDLAQIDQYLTNLKNSDRRKYDLFKGKSKARAHAGTTHYVYAMHQ
tara:strand:+ start:476 stop:676 length:201 start_codon:yes stop_codon:yes gene_type:complete